MVAAVVAVAGMAVSAYGASQQASAAKKGAAGQAQAAIYATDEQRREYDQSRQDQMPWLNAGTDALTRQQAALNGDFSGFNQSPDYAYAKSEMIQGDDRSAAAHGRLMSGGYGVDLATDINGLAEQNFSNYWNRLAGRAGQGQSTAQNLGAAGQHMADQVGDNYRYSADARASAYQQQANAWSNMGNQMGQWGAWYAGQRG